MITLTWNFWRLVRFNLTPLLFDCEGLLLFECRMAPSRGSSSEGWNEWTPNSKIVETRIWFVFQIFLAISSSFQVGNSMLTNCPNTWAYCKLGLLWTTAMGFCPYPAALCYVTMGAAHCYATLGEMERRNLSYPSDYDYIVNDGRSVLR